MKMIMSFCRGAMAVALMCPALCAAAQSTMPDRVPAGSRRCYRVDSTRSGGSTYTWAIDGITAQSGTACTFEHTWTSEGLFKLSVTEVSAKGCSGTMQAGEVIVLPPERLPEPGIMIFPNPLRGPEMRFRLTVPVSSRVTIDVFTPSGQLIDRIFEGDLKGGEAKGIGCNRQLPQGIYPYQITTYYRVFTGRLVFITAY